MRKLNLLAAAAALATALPALAAPTYTLTDIGDLPGATNYSAAYGINNLGQVVGTSNGSGGQQGFVWTNGVMTALPHLPGGGITTARSINDAGQIVGTGTGPNNANTGNANRGIIWTNGVATSMGDLPGGTDYSQAHGINNSGQVGGTSYATTQPTSAMWQSGGLTNLGDLPGAISSQGFAINDSGHIVGTSVIGSVTKATLFANGQATDLGDLPGGAVNGQARGISNAGHIVGLSSTTTTGTNSVVHAFMWIDGVMTDLGDLAGGIDGGAALGVNSAGRAVGYGYDVAGLQATMWFGSEIFSLASLVSNLGGWRLQQATAINERGQIVGIGTLGSVTHAFLLTPDGFDDAVEVPAPAALGLFGLGFVGLALRRRRNG